MRKWSPKPSPGRSKATPNALADYEISALVSEPPVYIFELDVKSKTSASGRLFIALDSENDAQTASGALPELSDELMVLLGVQNARLNVSGTGIEVLFDFTFSEPRELITLLKKFSQP